MILPGIGGCIAGPSAGSVAALTRYNYLGATTAENLSRATSANTLYLQKVTLTAGTVKNLFVRQRAATAAGIHLKGVIYSDSAGSPGSLLNTGSEATTVSLGTDTDVALGFASDPVLAAADYWIGYLADGAFAADGNNATVAIKSVAATYASGPPASPGGFSSSANGIVCYLSLADSTAVAGTVGYVSNVTSAVSAAANRLALPSDRAPNDIALVHVTYTNVSAGPTWTAPTNFTLIDEQIIQAGNFRELLYWKRLNGSEGYVEISETGSTPSVLQVTASIWRGYLASGTPYEAYANSTNLDTAPKGTAITTLGANRTVANFYSNDQANAAGAPGNAGANGWADNYALATLVGNDCSSTCSFKDVAVAGAVAAETRTFAAANRWRSFTLALIKA